MWGIGLRDAGRKNMFKYKTIRTHKRGKAMPRPTNGGRSLIMGKGKNITPWGEEDFNQFAT